MIIGEHDVVVLTGDVPDAGLEAGDIGTVVHVHSAGAGYEVEFMTLTGDTVAVVTLRPAQISPGMSLMRVNWPQRVPDGRLDSRARLLRKQLGIALILPLKRSIRAKRTRPIPTARQARAPTRLRTAAARRVTSGSLPR